MCVSAEDMSCEVFLGAGQAKSLGGLDRDWPRDNHVPYPCHFRDRVSLALCLSMPWPTSPKKSKCLANLRTQGNADQKRNKNQRNATSIEIATRAADHFTRLYYSAYDSSTRVDDLPNFYRPNSAVSWNGNPYEGAQGVRDLVAKMPKTQHEVQSFDCHPIPGGLTHGYAPAGPLLTQETGSQPPSLLITVSGNVTHGGGPGANPPSTHKKVIEGHPRVFSQTFMLVPDNTAATKVGEVAKYYIIADTMRFVG
jgi:NTF2-related export protein 1/2